MRACVRACMPLAPRRWRQRRRSSHRCKCTASAHATGFPPACVRACLPRALPHTHPCSRGPQVMRPVRLPRPGARLHLVDGLVLQQLLVVLLVGRRDGQPLRRQLRHLAGLHRHVAGDAPHRLLQPGGPDVGAEGQLHPPRRLHRRVGRPILLQRHGRRQHARGRVRQLRPCNLDCGIQLRLHFHPAVVAGGAQPHRLRSKGEGSGHRLRSNVVSCW